MTKFRYNLAKVEDFLLLAHFLTTNQGHFFRYSLYIFDCRKQNICDLFLPHSLDLNPYKCTDCKKSFHRRVCLLQHMIRGHQKPFECNYCKVYFRSKNEFDKHMAHVHQFPPFICIYWNHLFSHNSDLKKHLLERHPNTGPKRCVFFNFLSVLYS